MQDFEKVSDFKSMYFACLKARLGKRWKQSTVKFEINLLEAIHLLCEQLNNKTYRLSPYNVFKVYEPKTRIVMSNGYKDKVVQHALCDNVLEPRLTKSFIKDNSASQRGKGTDHALKRIKEHFHSYYRKHGSQGWVLKCDVRKYFYNIRHDILKKLIFKKITCPNTRWLISMIIDSTEGNVGIPIGNQSSQLFALEYLNHLDHYIKEVLKIKYYGRYMDDFYLISESKEHLKYCKTKITEMLLKIGLELNEKTNILPLKNGIDFCGFHTYLTDTGKVYMKIRAKSKNNRVRKLKKFKNLLDEGKITLEKIEQSYNSWKGHAKRGNTHHLMQKMDQLYNQLFKKEKEHDKTSQRIGGGNKGKGSQHHTTWETNNICNSRSQSRWISRK